jgi:hypothetical protein
MSALPPESGHWASLFEIRFMPKAVVSSTPKADIDRQRMRVAFARAYCGFLAPKSSDTNKNTDT